MNTHNGHQYFVGVLEEVYQILKSKCVKKTEKSKGQVGYDYDKEPEPLANLPENLEMGECRTAEASTTTPVPAPTKKVEPVYSLEPSAEDIPFAIFCFLKDYTDVRLLVHKT